MKKIAAKMGYIALGSLLTLIGYHFGNIDENRADAQGVEIIDEIACRKLVIVGDDLTPRIVLKTDDVDNGRLLIFNEKPETRVMLGVIQADRTDAGIVTVSGTGMTLAAKFGANANGGSLSLFNKISDKGVIQAGVTDKGEGIIIMHDSEGNFTDVVGAPGAH